MWVLVHVARVSPGENTPGSVCLPWLNNHPVSIATDEDMAQEDSSVLCYKKEVDWGRVAVVAWRAVEVC